MQRRRLVVAVVALLVFRGVTRGQAVFSSALQRTRDTIDPVVTDIMVLWGTVFGESIGAGMWFTEPVGVGLLYLSVFFLTIRAVYPDTMWEALETAGVERAFEGVVSVHILAVFLTYRLLQADMGVLVFGDVFGVPANVLLFLYFGLFVPLSIGYLLSVTEDGFLSEPDAESPTFALIQGFSANAEALDPDDLDGPAAHWLLQGVVHTIPVLILGGLFVGFDLVFPAVEVLLAIGVLATLSPWQTIPPGDVSRYDIETRLATILKFATVNAKGFSTVIIAIVGFIFGGAVLVILAPVVLGDPAPGHNVVSIWNRFGFALALCTFAAVSTLWWLSVGDRLPHFIPAWTDRYDTFEGQSVLIDARPRPRFPVGLAIPAGWLTLSLILPYSTHTTLNSLYAVVWPGMALACCVQYVPGLPSVRSGTDNMAIARTITIQAAFFPLAVGALDPSANLTSTGLLTVSPLLLFAVVAFPVLLLGLYASPDAFHLVNQWGQNNTIGERQKDRILVRGIIYLGLAVFGMIGMFLTFGYLSLTLIYLFGAIVTSFAIISQLDASRFARTEPTRRELAGFVLYFSIFAVGLGLSLQFDSGPPMFPPQMLIQAGALGIVATAGLLAYDWFERQYSP